MVRQERFFNFMKKKYILSVFVFFALFMFCGMILPIAAQNDLPPDDSNAPALTAEEISKRMIELIKFIKTKEDISPENIERMMKINVKFNKKERQNYGFGGLVEGATNWAYNLSAYPYPSKDNKETDTVNFSFNPLTDDEKTPRDDYAPVCTVDFDAYSRELKAAGFSSAPYYGEHGRLLWWNFSRGAVSAQITAYGENEKRVNHKCVSMLTISVNGLAESVIEETGPPPPPTPKPTPILKVTRTPPETLVGDNVFKTIFRNLILDIPRKMFQLGQQTPEHTKYLKDFEIKTNGNTVWTDESDSYEVWNPRKESLLKVEVVTSLYNADFTKVAIDGKTAGAMPKELLRLDYLAEKKAEEQSESLIKTVKYFIPNKLKPGQGVGQGQGSVERESNVEGVYQMSDVADDKDCFVLTWHTYRLVNNKAQKLKIVISGKKSEISVAEAILDSAVFEKNSQVIGSSETFKTESINKFGISRISVPSNMTAEPLTEKTRKNGDVEWTTYDYVWKTPASKYSSDSSLKVEVSTKIYNADFKKIAVDILVERRTPEFLILMDQVGNSSVYKQFGDNRMKESKIVKLSGVDGSYALFRIYNNIFVANWQTYRLLDGKAQTISVTIEGDPGEISKAEQIIKSFELSAK
jgi:hypothetical protein